MLEFLVQQAGPRVQGAQVLGARALGGWGLAVDGSGGGDGAGGLAGDGGGSNGDHALEDELLAQTAADTPVEEASGVLPGQGLADGVLGHHAAGAVVEISELQSDLQVDRKELLFASGHLGFDL